jgi:hypothetical protein
MVIQTLKAYADRQGWTDDFLVAVLGGYVEDNCDEAHFTKFLDTIVECETAPAAVPPPATPPVAAQNLETFFDEDLLAASLQNMELLVTASTASTGELELGGQIPESWQLVQALLSAQGPADGFDPDGGVLYGYYTLLTDGGTAVFAICNAPTGPYVDAYYVFPPGTNPPQRHISLQPTRRLAGETFVFTLPGGSLKIRFIHPA